MCGLVGVAGNLSIRGVTAFKELLHADYLRGMHSTGIGFVHPGWDMTINKLAVSPEELMNYKIVDTKLNSSMKVLMGHNRHATRGKINKVNAHPFESGDIMGAHNGTLDYQCLNGANKLSENTVGETDSERLINTINDEDRDIVKAIARTSGAWALSIYDRADKTISLLCNDQRPLFYVLTEDAEMLFWASESYMLQWILHRNGIKFKKVFMVPDDTLLTWGIPSHRETFRERPQRLACPGKRVENFPVQNYNRPPAHKEGEEPWRKWGVPQQGVTRPPMQQQGNPLALSAPQNQPTASGDASKSSGDNDKPIPWISKNFTDDDVKRWKADIVMSAQTEADIYSAGWSDGCDGIECNPFDKNLQTLHHQEYQDGCYSGFAHANGLTDSEKTRTPARVETDILGVPLDASITTPTKPKVILVGDLKEDKQSNIFQIRTGPDGKRITPARFRELTGHKCGWCDGKIKADDGGAFTMISKTEHIYAGECCIKDPNLTAQKDVA